MEADKALSVSEITELIKGMLEGAFPTVLIEGEISNWRPSSAGHCYFALKDREAVIQVVMFKSRASRLRFAPSDGVKVRARGAISVYAQRGNYQIICEDMELAGSGDILAMLEERKRRLAAEGLFDEGRKRPLPRFPERIGVVTSPTGAAIRDIVSVARRRNPSVGVLVLPALVQGEGAAASIVARIEEANEWGLCDLLIVGRGGGSLEDLLPFSDESVVRAVAASRIPVISAVGHEIDWALSDFAADLRAPTPSAAAELAIPPAEELLGFIETLSESMGDALRSKVDRLRIRLGQDPLELLESRFRQKWQPLLLRLDDAKEGMIASLKERIGGARHRVDLALRSVEASSPGETLRRGYAVVRRSSGGPALLGAAGLARGDGLKITFSEGLALARFEEAVDEEV